MELLTTFFEGENFRGSVGKEHFAENIKTGRIMGVACLEFHGENFKFADG